MSDQELQEEEREVLSSIYEGDESFKQLSPTVFQYKYGKDEDIKSFLIELQWGETYPTNKPTINMDTFYNKHIIPNVKKAIIESVSNEAEQFLGCAMTYSLFEYVKENYEKLIADQPDSFATVSNDMEKVSISNENDNMDNTSKKAPKKEQLTKAQKRRQWDRADGKGERPRGWDWVDIVKHLSQTGSKEDSAPIS